MRRDVHSSIDALAEAVRQGFEAVDARFDATDRKIESVRAELKDDIVLLQGDVKSLQGDVRRIDGRLVRQQEMIDEDRTDYRSLSKRVVVVEAKLEIAPA